MSLHSHDRVAVLTAVVLVVALGLCLAHADDGPDPDLCGAAVLSTAVAGASALLSMTGRPVLAPISAYHRPVRDRPTPPPRA